MRRLFRWTTRLVLFVLLASIVAIAGFRTAAALRETSTPFIAAGKGALFATIDGRRMHYREWGPQTGRPLILLHGAMAWSGTFVEVAEPLGAQGFRVIAPDLPPFGFSERAPDDDYSRAAQGARILAFADELGLDRFSLGVHSNGGGAALEAAFVAPQRMESLVLLNVALGLGEPSPPAIPLPGLFSVDAVRQTVVASTFTNPLLFSTGLRFAIDDPSAITSERVARYAEPLNVAGTTRAIARWLISGLYGDERKSRAHDLAAFKAFDKPVLVIWGRDDTITPLAQGEAIAAAFPSADLQVLDGVNHIPHIEKPDQVVRRVAAFLKRVAGHAGEIVTAGGKGDRVLQGSP